MVLVAQSMGGLTAPLVCERVPVALLVLVNAMVPRPGETGGEWWAVTGSRAGASRRGGAGRRATPDETTDFFHDVPDDGRRRGDAAAVRAVRPPVRGPVAADALARRARRGCVGGRDDRFFPIEFQRRVAAERLGLPVDEVPGGHLVALSRPVELADRLEAYLAELPDGTSS